MLQIVAKGKLDYAEGVWLIRDDRVGMKVLDGLLYPYIGERIVISVEEPEEELDPIISKRLKELVWPTTA